ncbi:hypothetical protein RISK_002440 [Rhodopirellula islandica]|uniref:Uncharacterized protein n=1 Tax=Rhodopirellula islandica TaxID=595434 RepID=A0A0J1BGW8_RHOIS|nr:hypothetical protein RISK_002440 [Rhodopirellula islandica]
MKCILESLWRNVLQKTNSQRLFCLNHLTDKWISHPRFGIL